MRERVLGGIVTHKRARPLAALVHRCRAMRQQTEVDFHRFERGPYRTLRGTDLTGNVDELGINTLRVDLGAAFRDGRQAARDVTDSTIG